MRITSIGRVRWGEQGYFRSRKWSVLGITTFFLFVSTSAAVFWVWSDLKRQAHAHFKVWEEDISEELLAKPVSSSQNSTPSIRSKVIAHWQGLAPWTEVRVETCGTSSLSHRLPLTLYGTVAQELWICTTKLSLLKATIRSPQATAMWLLALLINVGVILWNWVSWQRARLTHLEIQAHRRQSLWSERLAHDLRSPLMGLMSLEKSWPADSQDLFSATIRRLESMADQLLLEGRRLGTSRSLRQSLSTLLAELTTRFSAARQSIVIDHLERDELIDEDIERALHTLIQNALEASQNRPVQVQLITDNEAVRVLIKDQGPGLSDEKIQLLGKERFAPNPEKAHSRGVGAWSAGETARLRGGQLQFRNGHPRGLEAEFTFRRQASLDELVPS